MGIDLHNLNFLAHAQDLGVRYERTLAIGRQGVFVDAPDLERHRTLRGRPVLSSATWFEPLLAEWFGARDTHSVDASPYEQATMVHDMNLPWTDAPAEGYDAVLDFGCLEHVFDFPTAWRNCTARVKTGGHILHALPANNLCGHGFYQFSPELFCNLYQPARGWELQGLFFAMKADGWHWWRVANPLQVKRRVNLANAHETYLMVLAKKTAEPATLPAPQQSDYAQAAWVDGLPPPAAQPSRLQGPLAALGLLDTARRWRARWQAMRSAGVDLPPPDYERVAVDRLIAR